MPRGWRLTSRQFVPAAREEVFPFFADAHNLEEITPSSLRFNVLTPRPIEMREGVRIEYRLWVHEHTFEEVDGGTVLGDTVDYDIAGGPLAPIAERLFVRRDVIGIFEYRRRWIAERFGGDG